MPAESHDLIAAIDFPDLRPEVTEELQDAWRAARDEALLSYRDWCAAAEEHLERAYFAYLASADREEAAALHLQRNVETEAPSAGCPGADGR